MKDWLSSTEKGLVVLCRKWLLFFEDESIALRFGWTEAECAAVAITITAFLKALTAYEDVNSSANRMEKDATKKTAVAAMRKFANTSVRFNEKMDEAARTEMGIRQRDTTPTIHPRPSSRPETVVENTKNRMEHNVKAISNESRGASKPSDAYGVRFGWQVGGEKPVGGEDLPKSKFSRKTSLIITYTEADKGKPAYYATCYENSKGEAGPWSLLTEAYIG